jgi:hypothetical protein
VERYDDERLAELLRRMPSPPRIWVDAAKELPYLLRGVDAIVAEAARDDAVARAFADDPESVIREYGLEPTAEVVAHLRRRLG